MNFEISFKALLLSIVIAVFSVPVAFAQSEMDNWELEVGLYGFIPVSVDGSSTVDGGTVGLDLGPDEIFDIFQFAIAGRAEGWRNKNNSDGSAFGFVIDANYVDLGLDATVGGVGGVNVDIRQAYADFLLGYKFASIKTDAQSDQALTFDVTGGMRYNYMRQKIKVSPALPAPFTVNLGSDETWLEPVVGARANYRINDRWNLVLRGDVAGFDIDDSLSWSATGLAAWRFGEKTTLRFGYRVYDMDYSTGSGSSEFGFDATLHGPFMGLTYRF